MWNGYTTKMVHKRAITKAEQSEWMRTTGDRMRERERHASEVRKKRFLVWEMWYKNKVILKIRCSSLLSSLLSVRMQLKYTWRVVVCIRGLLPETDFWCVSFDRPMKQNTKMLILFFLRFFALIELKERDICQVLNNTRVSHVSLNNDLTFYKYV